MKFQFETQQITYREHNKELEELRKQNAKLKTEKTDILIKMTKFYEKEK